MRYYLQTRLYFKCLIDIK